MPAFHMSVHLRFRQFSQQKNYFAYTMKEKCINYLHGPAGRAEYPACLVRVFLQQVQLVRLT
jgi:hypothetical protein